MDSPSNAPRPSVRGRSRTPINYRPPAHLFRYATGPVEIRAAASSPATSTSGSTSPKVAPEVVEVIASGTISDSALDKSVTQSVSHDVIDDGTSEIPPVTATVSTSDNHVATRAPDDPTSQKVAERSISAEVIVTEKSTASTTPEMTKRSHSDDTAVTGAKKDCRQKPLRANGNGKAKKVVKANLTPPGCVDKPVKKDAVSVNLCSNFFRLKTLPSWGLHAYSVKFDSKVATPAIQKLLRKTLEERKLDVGLMFYDDNLFTSKRLKDLDIPLDLTVKLDKEDKPEVEIFMTYIGKVDPDSPIYDQLHTSLLRKCLFALELEPIGSHFYEPKSAIQLPKLKLELWPGYITSIRRYEGGAFYLCVDPTFKVLGRDNVLQVIRGIEKTGNFPSSNDDLRRKAVTNTNKIGGAMLMTTYNRRTYRVADIDFKMTPQDTFHYKEESISFANYYEKRYGLKITDLEQPLIITQPNSKNRQSEERTILIPELCRIVGLTEAMRMDWSLMKELGKFLNPIPTGKVNRIERFVKRLRSSPPILKELGMWGLEFDDTFLDLDGRILGNQNIHFAKGTFPVNQKGQFNLAFRSQQMLSTVALKNWVIIVPRGKRVWNLVKTMRKQANTLGMEVSDPRIHDLPDTKPQTYLAGIQQTAEKRRGIQMVLLILPDNRPDIYAAAKRRLTVELGIPSQCFLATNIDSDNLMNIVSKLVVQINAKLGGEPWSVKLPLKNAMFIGFDVYKGETGIVGAMVSTFSSNFTKYFSTTSVYGNPEEMSNQVWTDVLKCTRAYQEENNGLLPEMIIMYRAGVRETQLKMICQTELQKIKEELAKTYEAQKLAPPRLSFIVARKTTGTNLFQRDPTSSYENPPLRTLVDSVITLPDQYDFYLISCGPRQGAVSPCSYTVLCDESGLDPDKIQMATYKLCHMYYNYNGTMAIPAPCQYAGKLAFLTATVYGGPANDKLSRSLHFL